MSDSTLDLRLALSVVVAWLALGVLLGMGGIVALAPMVSALLCAVLLALAHWRRRAWWGWGAVAAGAAAILLASAAAHADERQPATLLALAAEGRHLTMEATLTKAVVEPTESARVGATVHTLRAGEEVLHIAVPVTLFAAFKEPGEVGDAVTVSGTLVANGPAETSAFLVFARGDAEVREGNDGPVAWAGELREGFRMLVERLPGPGAGLLPGLAIGDTSAVDATLDEQMKASSLTHLTAVSGANCAIVVGLVLALGGALRVPRWLRIAGSLLVLAGFVLIVTPEPSVLRAAVMAVAVLIARLLGRGASGVPVLALAVLILLAIDPWLARSYGFVLSVLATAGLLVLAGPLSSRLERWMPRPLAILIAVPLAAQLACQPVIILLAPEIPLYGVIANLLAGPAAPAATVLGLVACVLAPLAPWLASCVAWAAWLPSAWIAAVASFFAELPGSRLPWAEGAVGLAVAALLTVLGLGLLLAARRRWWALGLCACLAVVGGVVAGERVRVALVMPRDWQFAACDVGQGDAHLLRDGDAIMLVDTGAEVGALEDCLTLLGVDHIDTLVLTHFDLDHVGAVDAVVGRVDTVIAGPPGEEGDERMLQRLAEAGAEVIEGTRGLRGGLGRLMWSVLWPAPRSYVPPGNDASVVLAVDGRACDCLTSVLLGDLGEEAQTRMLSDSRHELAALGAIDVVKVSHHGSADQSARLYEFLSADLGMIGVGEANTYGHPAPSILAVLERTGATIARTDRQGLVLAWRYSDGRIGLWLERGDDAPGSEPGSSS
ncbi:ComEC/Rec2 family competence protein [Salinibacterium sp. SYSU T00001]|uniref:ComEC/Rec2 family competence protein n=1 Tax=Homoserinimonas sedimenticola TaxID=2986805 RepID=UPI00223600E8|nr:ComEC/Rec2 family competence protein [Salinibacterium sedimenticola]MCW4384604.1 ComEC/Rec2 family competence protein [Salinibacterium sedimenticola]